MKKGEIAMRLSIPPEEVLRIINSAIDTSFIGGFLYYDAKKKGFAGHIKNNEFTIHQIVSGIRYVASLPRFDPTDGGLVFLEGEVFAMTHGSVVIAKFSGTGNFSSIGFITFIGLLGLIVFIWVMSFFMNSGAPGVSVSNEPFFIILFLVAIAVIVATIEKKAKIRIKDQVEEIKNFLDRLFLEHKIDYY